MSSKKIDALPDSALLRMQDLLDQSIWPGGRSTLWEAIRQERFPKPVKVGVNTTAWRMADLRAWQRALEVKP